MKTTEVISLKLYLFLPIHKKWKKNSKKKNYSLESHIEKIDSGLVYILFIEMTFSHDKMRNSFFHAKMKRMSYFFFCILRSVTRTKIMNNASVYIEKTEERFDLPCHYDCRLSLLFLTF